MKILIKLPAFLLRLPDYTAQEASCYYNFMHIFVLLRTIYCEFNFHTFQASEHVSHKLQNVSQ